LLHGTFSSASKAAVKWSFDADESRRRARTEPCFEGLVFLLGSTVPPPAQLGLVIESAGGKVVSRLPPDPSGDEQTRHYAVLSLPADKVRAASEMIPMPHRPNTISNLRSLSLPPARCVQCLR
jgi:hypothetical protein